MIALTNRGEAGAEAFSLPADGWYHVAREGEFPITTEDASGAPLKLLQVLDSVAFQAMARALPPGEELLIDFEHFSHDPEKSSEAAGWIQNIEARADGLWILPRWSDAGKAALVGGRYRYLSPVWFHANCEPLAPAADGTARLRPLRLHDAGLTNTPNIKGLLPLANRLAPYPTQTQPKKDPMLKPETIAALLAYMGLPAEATDEQVSAVIASEKVEDAALANRLKETTEALVDNDLAKYGDRIAEATKPAWRASLLSNRAGTLALLDGIVAPTKAAATGALTNRATAANPGADKTGATDAAPELPIAQQQANAIRGIRMANRGLSHEAAYHQAKATHPALFASAAAAAE